MRQQRTSKTPRRRRRRPAESPPFDARAFHSDTAGVDALLARIDHVLEDA